MSIVYDIVSILEGAAGFLGVGLVGVTVYFIYDKLRGFFGDVSDIVKDNETFFAYIFAPVAALTSTVYTTIVDVAKGKSAGDTATDVIKNDLDTLWNSFNK
jgi:hypothetical protein